MSHVARTLIGAKGSLDAAKDLRRTVFEELMPSDEKMLIKVLMGTCLPLPYQLSWERRVLQAAKDLNIATHKLWGPHCSYTIGCPHVCFQIGNKHRKEVRRPFLRVLYLSWCQVELCDRGVVQRLYAGRS